jgi:hypothetical protein
LAAHRIRSRALSALVGVGVLGVVGTACAPDPPPPPPTVYDAACNATLVASTPGSVALGAVGELSGIVASRRNPGVWWVENDSGNPNAVYAIGDDGRDLGTFTLTGTTNVDWEDIAVGPGPDAGTSYLYVADIGNNNTPKRNAVDVYRVAEPSVSSAASSGAVSLGGATKLTFSYPGGATPDAEALLVDPTTGEMFVVTKVGGGVAQVYRANVGTATWDPVATVSRTWVTGADVTPAGDFVVLVTYGSVVVYPRPAGGSLADAFGQAPCAGGFPALTPGATQYEAIGFTPDGRGYVTASEGANPPLHQFHAP